jgi:hypothetical protein
VIQLGSHIDTAAREEKDRLARQADADSIDELLIAAARNDKKLTKLLELDTIKDQRQKQAEIKDLAQLCSRHLNSLTPGQPETLFFEAVQVKVAILSGGHLHPDPEWVISKMEVDLDERESKDRVRFFCCNRGSHWIFFK